MKPTEASSSFDPTVGGANDFSLAPALDSIDIVLSHPSHPGNIGAAARAMKTMGLSRLILVNPRQFPHAEAVARSAGAEDLLARACVCASLDEALAGGVAAFAVSARHRNLGPAPLSSREAGREVLAQARAGRVALVFGNETSGLSNDEVQRCQRTVFIPSNPAYASLNLGAAVQVLCYELRLEAFNGAPPVAMKTVPFASPPATHDEIERFYTHLERVMVATGFLDPEKPRRLLPKLRRLFGRAELEKDEINILRGVLDAVEKQIGR